MEKISDIIESIANEKGLEIEEVKERVIRAFINSAKKLFGEDYEYEAVLDASSKNIKLFQKILVVANDDERVHEGEHIINISKAKEIDSGIEIGDELSYDINLENLGRTASETLSRELNYHIQRLLEEKLFEKYNSKVGTLVFGTVTHVDSDETTFVEIDDLKAFMPRKNRIKDEKFKVGDIARAVIRRVFVDKSQGIKIEISRTSPKFLEAMLEVQVPEIKDGNVIIKSCARIPGKRAKVALLALSPNVDPVGATVGTKGVRINAVSKELKNENIDAIEYSSQPELMVSRAIAPAIVNAVKVNGKKATIYINSEQKSKAIGKDGINIRLASMLTGYEIELVESKTADERNGETSLAVKDLKSLFGDI
ncbi:transcription termination factor NusA [Campylobacter geochelonis]|uniref:Transcription termination/antitermination protein NusA n=1 Tax=Campylobacter geochelonis TaxID=1780362 RepID=A0A128EQJ5_9BACT|nr:transcription termination factor NusA [Campylobacter geochelonis]QKF71901.1 transcription termination factor [Campylobacter geochelonis]CZE47116.1 transcription elongation factor NusA [Campylobacter geochelonis]CZE47910.1 transcription elongation factor NusA [Campylobacter geochelonis]CZE51013.1 transcription elongation factor NusA [Campylobacter geochelonis]